MGVVVGKIGAWLFGGVLKKNQINNINTIFSSSTPTPLSLHIHPLYPNLPTHLSIYHHKYNFNTQEIFNRSYRGLNLRPPDLLFTFISTTPREEYLFIVVSLLFLLIITCITYLSQASLGQDLINSNLHTED